ncbi:MAG: NAD(P)-dependent oxidoreductase, partial [Pseudomonadota bacterium]
MSAFEDMRLVVLGYGYSAAAFVRAIGPGHCTGTTRSAQKAAALRAQGIHAVVDDGNGQRELAKALHGATHVLVSAAPGADGDPFLEAFAADFHKARDLTWIGYLSTVGVYGNHDGALIDEDAARRATSQRGVWRVAAEDAWWALGDRLDVPVGVFRLAGIYGPGRNQLVSLREGRAKRLVKPGQVFNRIHV